ncbi:MAG: nitroreductase family protein [Dehalococcoidia bacterium]
MAEISLFEAITTQRAVRRLKPDPVDDALIERVLDAATRAPSARNMQPWHFIVVRDPETKEKLGAIFDELGAQMYGAGAPDRTPWGEVPVLIVVCSVGGFGSEVSGVMALDASIYPAVQNLLLAARALGLGTVLTTRWKRREPEIRPLLGLPDTVSVHAIVPLGWPTTRFGPTSRRPVAEVTSRERYGQPWRA